MFRKKPIQLTNWQVPKSPDRINRDQLKKAVLEGDLSHKTRGMGKIVPLASEEAIVKSIMDKQLAAGTIKIVEEDPRRVNLNGIVDDRAGRVPFDARSFVNRKK